MNVRVHVEHLMGKTWFFHGEFTNHQFMAKSVGIPIGRCFNMIKEMRNGQWYAFESRGVQYRAWRLA